MKRKFKISSNRGWTLALAVVAMLAVMFAAPLQAGAAYDEQEYFDAVDNTCDWSNWTASHYACTATNGNLMSRLSTDSNGTTYTPSANTGPTAFHSGTAFLYLENSGGPYTPDRTFTRNASFDADTYELNISFAYAMYGANMGTVRLEANDGSGWVTEWEQVGDDGNGGAWTDVSLDLFNGGGASTTQYDSGSVDLRFVFVSGSSFAGDAAIDTIRVFGPDRCSTSKPSDLAGSDAAGNPVEVDLTWTYDSANEYYTVYRDGAMIANNITTGSYTDSTVLPLTTYDYTVRGWDDAYGCQSGDSNTANVTTNDCTDGDPSTITVLTGQVANGDPYDVSGLFSTTGDVGSFEYKVTGGSGAGTSTYDYSTGAGSDKWAYEDNNNYRPTAGNPPADNTEIPSSIGVELSGANYTSIGTDDTNNFTDSGSFNDANAIQMNIDIAESPASINSMDVTFTGSGASNLTLQVYIWNFTASSWQIFDNTMSIGTSDTTDTASYDRTGLGFADFVSSGQVNIVVQDSTNANTAWNVDYLKLDVNYDSTLLCTDWTSSSSIPASTAGGSNCGDYTDGGTYTLDVRGTDPDCNDPVASGGAQDFTWNACDDLDTAVITINPPTSSSTISGIYTITATVTDEDGTMSNMLLTTSGSACDVTDASMTNQGSGVWTYSWDTTGCGDVTPETGITINVRGTDPDCGTTRNAAQVSDITVDNTCQETASVYLSQVGSTSGLIQQPIRGTVTVSAALLGTGGSNPRVSTNGSTWNAVPYSYSPPASSSGTVTFFVNATGYCGEITGAYDPSSVDYNTLANDYTITTCSECHYEPPTDGASRDNPTGAVVGSHYAHDRAGFACTDCHVNNTATDHREGLIEMSGYGANYTEGASFAQDNVPTLGTCANLNCHGTTTPTWGDNSRTDGDCAICHGMSDSGKTGRDTAGNVATNDPQVGAHATHLNSSNNLSDDVDCAECHTSPSGADYLAKVVEGSGHNDTALPAELNWGPTAVTNGLSPNFITGTRVCNNTWCHGTQLGEGDQTPAWDNDSLLTGSNADCQTCHDHPVYGGGTAVQAHQSGAYTSAMSGPDRCKTCHPDMNNSNDYLFDATDNHVDGKIDAWTCITCHNAQQPATGANRRIVTGASGDIGTTSAQGLASHHIQPDASGVQDDTCLACHYQDMPKLTDGVNVRLYDPDSGSIVTYDGTGASVEDFCNNCHDSGGATRLASPTQPFGSSGDTTAPPATGWIKTVSVHKDVDIGSDSSKEKCMGCHGKAGAGGGTLDPAQNAHGSGQTKLMRFTYAGTETVTNANNVCYNCHGNPVANGAVDDLESQFGLTSKHSSVTCLDCHNVHQAAAGTHAAQDNKAGNVLNGVSGAELTTLPAFAADPVVGDFTAKTIVGGTDLEATLCFKCHTVYNASYNASSPSGGYNMTDVAREFNPNNVGNYAGTWASGETAGSFHPVLAAATGNLGRTNNILSPWSTDSVMSCTDCHDSQTTTDPKGPHGSAAGFILKGPNTTWDETVTTGSAGMPAGTFCANCHDAGFSNSRFATHYSRSNHRVQCSKCHVMIPHGSEHPGLLHTAAGRGSGVPAPTWTNNAPYMRASTGNRLYIASYPSSQSGGWGQNNCGCNGSGH